MTIPSPFNTNFPLYSAPFNSRIQSQMDSTKNYFLVGFKPGFPLQAAELNELQEIFYTQQTLTQNMFANWHDYPHLQQGGTSMTATPWSGCTPLSPSLVSKTTSGGKTSVTMGVGWYLIKDPSINGGLGVWVYNSTLSTPVSGYDGNGPATLDGDYGIIVKLVTVNCTTSSTPTSTEDRSLQDGTGISVVNGPCGAARIQMQIVGFGKSGTQGTGETFLPIFTAGRTSGVVYIRYKNLYTLS
jgi:hypothetical protein